MSGSAALPSIFALCITAAIKVSEEGDDVDVELAWIELELEAVGDGFEDEDEDEEMSAIAALSEAEALETEAETEVEVLLTAMDEDTDAAMLEAMAAASMEDDGGVAVPDADEDGASIMDMPEAETNAEEG